MANQNLLEKMEYVVGEAKPIEVTVRHLRGLDLTGGTASVVIYDSGGSQIYTAAITPTITGSRAELATIDLTTTGGSPTLPAIGNYEATIAFAKGTTTRVWKVPIEVVTQKS